MPVRQQVEHIGEPLALVLPRHIEAPESVLQGFVTHRHLAREGLLVEVHERTAQLEVLGEVVGPVHAEHRLALHVEYGVALHGHVHRGACIEDALIDDGHRTHGVVDGVVAVLGERDTACGDLHRAARHVVGTELDDIAARAGMLAREEEPCIEEELILTYLRHPAENEAGEFLTAARIIELVGQYVRTRLSPKRVAMSMNRLGFEPRRTKYSRGWIAVTLTAYYS